MIVDSPVAISIFMRGIYTTKLCYSSGELNHTGALLFQHFHTNAQLSALAQMGDISTLNCTLSDCILHKRSEASNPLPSRSQTSKAEAIASGLSLPIHYLWDGKQWLVRYEGLVFETLRVALRREQIRLNEASTLPEINQGKKRSVATNCYQRNRKYDSHKRKKATTFLRR